jgi:hypothetical protein
LHRIATETVGTNKRQATLAMGEFFYGCLVCVAEISSAMARFLGLSKRSVRRRRERDFFVFFGFYHLCISIF